MCVRPLCLAPFRSVLRSGSLSLCPCPLAVPALRQDCIAVVITCTLFLFLWQLHQQRVATATGDPLAEELATGHLELVVGRTRSYLGLGCPAGGPHSQQPSLAMNSAQD